MRKEELVAIVAAASFGFAVTNDRFLLQSFRLYPYVFLAFVMPAILLLLLNLNKIEEMNVFLRKAILSKMLLLCIVYASAAITFFSALQNAPNSSQIITINLTSVIVTVLLSIVFLKERTHVGRKIVGAILSFVGLVLVS